MVGWLGTSYMKGTDGLKRWWHVVQSSLGRRIGTALLLAPACYLAVRFFQQQPVEPLTFSSLVIDRILEVTVLAAAPCLLGVLVLYPAAARIAALAAALVAIALSLTIILAGLLRSGADLAVVAGALVALAGSTAVLVWRGRHIGRIRNAPLAIGAGVLAASLPLLQFLHASAFLPSQTDVAVGQEVSAEVKHEADAELTTEVSYKLTNETDKRVLVIGSRLEVCYSGEVERAEPSRDMEDTCFTRYDPVAAQAYLAANSSLTWRTIVAVPNNQRALRLEAYVVFARGDRLRFHAAAEEIGDLDSCADVRIIKADEESRYKGLAQRDKYLVYSDSIRLDRTHYHIQFDRPQSCWWGQVGDSTSADPAAEEMSLTSYYGVTESYQIQHYWLSSPEPPE